MGHTQTILTLYVLRPLKSKQALLFLLRVTETWDRGIPSSI